MKFLLAAINAKYIHSNPGVYSLRAFARTKIPWADIEIGEYTINHQMDLILQDIYRRKPDFRWRSGSADRKCPMTRKKC